ncbi:chemokine-like factor [Colius striatus]|nr:chemokine-like factor [Colius striatus]
MAVVEVDRGFFRSPRAALKIARTLLAFVTFVCFAASHSHGAYTALAAMETAITALFLLLYLLKLDKKMRCLFWPLADIFNSVIAALFLFIVCLFAIILKANDGTLAGGVLGLLLLVLCVADAVVLSKKISLDGPRRRTTPEN